MTSKTLIGLAAVTAAVVAGAIVAVMSRQSATERVVADAILLPGLMDRINDVDRITLAGPDSEFELRFDGARWTVPALADFPADFDKVKKALIGLAELRTVEAKTDDPERYGALGLAEPGAAEGGGTWVRLRAGGETPVAAAMLGSPGRGGADQVYARRDGEAGTWLARGEVDLGDTPLSWVNTMVLRLPGERVRRVAITHADGEQVVLAKESPDEESFDLVNMPEGAALRSPLTVDNLGRALAFLRFDAVAAAAEGPAPGAGDSTAVFETFDGATVTVTLEARGEGDDAEHWARFDAAWDAAAVTPPEEAPEAGDDSADAAAEDPEEPFDAEADIAQIAARTADWVFRIPDFKAEQLGMRMDRLIDLPDDESDEAAAAGDSSLVPGTTLPPGTALPPIIQLD